MAKQQLDIAEDGLPKKKRRIGKAARIFGHNAELIYVKEFRAMGFDKCCTSRLGSHLTDSAKIDLMFIPVNVQVKAGYNGGISAGKVLSEMKFSVKQLFPAHTIEYNAPSIMIHHKDGKSGVPRTELDSIVSMTFEDFKKLFRLAYLKNEKI